MNFLVAKTVSLIGKCNISCSVRISVGIVDSMTFGWIVGSRCGAEQSRAAAAWPELG